MLFFVHGEDVPGTLGEVAGRGHIGEQDKATCLFLSLTDAFGIRLYSNRQSITHGFDRAWLVGARSAPAIDGPFLHGHVHPMVGGVRGAELRRRRFRIGATEIILPLSDAHGALERAL